MDNEEVTRGTIIYYISGCVFLVCLLMLAALAVIAHLGLMPSCEINKIGAISGIGAVAGGFLSDALEKTDGAHE